MGPRPNTSVVLTAAAVLAGVAGYVDAISFARLLHVFPTNQSGNAVFLGMALGGESPDPAWRSLFAMAGFALGALASVGISRRFLGLRRGPALLLTEAVLLVVVVVCANVIDEEPARGVLGGAVIVVASVALGLQTEVIRRVSGVTIATTYQSGAIIGIGEELAGEVHRRTRLHTIGARLPMLGLVLVAYIAGAAFGAVVLDWWRTALVVPCVVVAVLAITWIALPDLFAEMHA
jgi:uncharacterized membrane protein YoaK (UPF0700 family)